MGKAWGGNTTAFAVGSVLAVVRLREVHVVHWVIWVSLNGICEEGAAP